MVGSTNFTRVAMFFSLIVTPVFSLSEYGLCYIWCKIMNTFMEWIYREKYIIYKFSSDELYLSHTQSIMRSEMCSLHLTHPSAHTWSSGQPTVRHPGRGCGLPARAGNRNPQPWVTSGFKSNALSIRPRLPPFILFI